MQIAAAGVFVDQFDLVVLIIFVVVAGYYEYKINFNESYLN